MAAEREAPQAPEARAFWSGTITFGLVSVPVDLYPAVRAERVPIRLLGPEGQPLERRYFCSADNEPLAADDIVRGYEWEDGSFTTVTDEELDALAPEKSRDIDLRRFVAREEIPAELLERPYVLAPAGESTKAYHLLAQTMERTGRAGIATFVMRGKEYLAAIFAEGGLLRAVTMRFVAELRTPADVGLPEVQRAPAAVRKEMENALAKLEKDDIDRGALGDEYSAALRELAEEKRAEGRDVVEVEEVAADEEQESAEIIDIMAVLKQRVAGEARRPARAERAERSEAEVAAGTPLPQKKAVAARRPLPQKKTLSQKQKGGRTAAQQADEGIAALSKKELYERAKALDVPNRSRLSKDELIAALRKAG